MFCFPSSANRASAQLKITSKQHPLPRQLLINHRFIHSICSVSSYHHNASPRISAVGLKSYLLVLGHNNSKNKLNGAESLHSGTKSEEFDLRSFQRILISLQLFVRTHMYLQSFNSEINMVVNTKPPVFFGQYFTSVIHMI